MDAPISVVQHLVNDYHSSFEKVYVINRFLLAVVSVKSYSAKLLTVFLPSWTVSRL